jgi:cbb3-type cytochrome oxidase subunit 3
MQQQISPEHLTLMIGSAIGAALFFIAVTAGIIFFFRRAERGDRAEAEKFSEENETALPSNEDLPR